MNLRHLCASRSIELQAIDRKRNCQRRYAITRTTDLFGAEIIELSWGRIGARGKKQIISAPSDKQGQKLVERVLSRREGAMKRIGTSYKPVGE